MTTQQCPVAESARALAVVNRTLNTIQAEKAKVRKLTEKGQHLDQEEAYALDDMRFLEEAVARSPAESLNGVIAQVAIMGTDVQMIADLADEQYRETVDTALRRVMRSLYSAMRVLERETGQRREDICGENYLARWGDPHEDGRVRASLAQTEKKEA